jgi:hypothetical protein
MTYTIYQTRAAALIANAEYAAANNCNMVTTTEWFPRLNHPDILDGRSALEDGIGIVTREELDSEGWFLV